MSATIALCLINSLGLLEPLDSHHALHQAARDGNALRVHMLLAVGVDPNVTDATGRTAADIAAMHARQQLHASAPANATSHVSTTSSSSAYVLCLKLLYRYDAKHSSPKCDIAAKGVTVGLTPAGSFTGDLDVPIRKQK